jgi:hypothetical protein
VPETSRSYIGRMARCYYRNEQYCSVEFITDHGERLKLDITSGPSQNNFRNHLTELKLGRRFEVTITYNPFTICKFQPQPHEASNG